STPWGCRVTRRVGLQGGPGSASRAAPAGPGPHPHFRPSARPGWRGVRARGPAGLTSAPRARASTERLLEPAAAGPRTRGQPFSRPAAPRQAPLAVPRLGHGYPLPQQQDPIINKSFLDPPLPRAPSGTLAAAAAADPFQKGGVAAARGSAGSVLGLSGGGARPLSPGRRERCERAPRAHWLRGATLPGRDWAAAPRGRGLPALVLIGLSARVLGTAAGRGGGAGGWKGQAWAALGGWDQFAHPFKRQDALVLAVLADGASCVFCGPASGASLQTPWRPSPSCLAFGIASRRRPPPRRPCPEPPPPISRRAQPGGRRPGKRGLAAARAWRARTASPWTAATVASGRRKVSRGPGPGSTRGGPGRWEGPALEGVSAALAPTPSEPWLRTGGRRAGGRGLELGGRVRGSDGGRRGPGCCSLNGAAPPPFGAALTALSRALSLADSAYLDGVSLPDFELLSDPEDEHLCANLMQLLQESLSQARLGSRRPARLLMPGQLVSQVGKELLRLAYSEPCGLRGALLDVCVEQGKSCHNVGQLALDPSLVPTFQLTLVLRLDSRLWPKIQGLFSSANSSFVPGFSQSLTLSTGFRVIKKKLYSSEQLLIEEC
uniref:DNA damage-inducible transcript 4 protein n=1 Tax=Canis lupus familiaris TaxID=9615 RepID=A0A8I3MTY4_CANLF